MTNHVCIDCQDDCAVCISRANHPAGKGRNPQVLPKPRRDIRMVGEFPVDFGELPEDLVNHPAHYTSDPSGVECIQITRHRSFNIGNAFKYLWRAGLKNENATTEDLQKAVFYIMDEIARLEGRR